MENLPADLHYFMVLFIKDRIDQVKCILNLTRVNKRFHSIYNNELLWHKLTFQNLTERFGFTKSRYLLSLKLLTTKDKYNKYISYNNYEYIVKFEFEKIIYSLHQCFITPELINIVIKADNQDKGFNKKIFFYLWDKVKVDDIPSLNEDNSIKYDKWRELRSHIMRNLAANGKWRIFEEMEKKGYEYDSKELIKQAAIYGHLEMFKYLEFKMGNLNSKYLIHACRSDNLELIKYIIEKTNPNILIIDKAIQKCSKIENIKYLWPLSSQTAEDLICCLTSILASGRFLIPELINLGLDINCNNGYILKQMIDKHFPLEDIKSLIDMGANVQIENYINDLSPIARTIKSSRKEVIEYLLEKGATISKEMLKYIKDKMPKMYEYLLTILLCKGKTKSGEACKRQSKNNGYCFQHCK